jgi:hypothetical protein
MPANHYAHGQWNAICDVCGFKFKSGELRRRWDGLMVCKDDYEVDHPQKHIRVKEDGLAVPWVRDEPEDTYLEVCDLWTASPLADYGTADCMTVGGNTSIPLLISLFDPTCIAGIALTGRAIPGVV